MAKKSLAAAPNRLSFDGGSPTQGGFGEWYPPSLSEEELKECALEDGKWIDAETASYASGCLVGQKAAEEYVRYLRAEKSNFWLDECDSGVAHIAVAMMQSPTDSQTRRRGEIIGFFATLYPYLAFGARKIRESDKEEGARK